MRTFTHAEVVRLLERQREACAQGVEESREKSQKYFGVDASRDKVFWAAMNTVKATALIPLPEKPDEEAVPSPTT